MVELMSRYWKHVVFHHVKTVARPASKAILPAHCGSFGSYMQSLRMRFRSAVDEGRPAEDGRGWIRSHRYQPACASRSPNVSLGGENEIVRLWVQHGLQAVTALKKGKTDARETSLIEPGEDAVIDAMLAYLPKTVADMIQFQRLTRCRPQEVCLLRPCDIDASGIAQRSVGRAKPFIRFCVSGKTLHFSSSEGNLSLGFSVTYNQMGATKRLLNFCGWSSHMAQQLNSLRAAT